MHAIISRGQRRSDRSEEFLALRDVSFDVDCGEAVGIIGRNGAGKSTLLKVLSRITEPTSGRALIRGRVASLLEVGTGFHPELTGRENVFLNGAILGMTKAEIRRKFDAIVGFAEVERFIDTPVKRYSSGMYVRLAFSVAAHLEPEILIVDEVLAVGDLQFQRKCLGRMGEIGNEGRTILFVSHNMASISALCDRVVWLEEGRVRRVGPASAVVGAYTHQGAEDAMYWKPERPASDAFEYHSVRIVAGNTGESSNPISPDVPIHILFDFTVKKEIALGRLSFRLNNQDGIFVLSSANTDGTISANTFWPKGRTVWRCTIPGTLLAPGRYDVSLPEPREDGGYVVHEGALSFSVSEANSLKSRDNRAGVVQPLLEWSSGLPT
jgi:lipopolysaccharide transport system ATP-binding protein